MHLHQAFWYENPQGKPNHWQKHFVVERVQAESPAFADLDGDERPDILTVSKLGAFVLINRADKR